MNRESLKKELQPYYEKSDCCSWIVELRKKVWDKNKEIKRLNNIINGIETYCNIVIGMNFNMNNNELQNQIVEDYTKMLDKLKALKEGKE